MDVRRSLGFRAISDTAIFTVVGWSQDHQVMDPFEEAPAETRGPPKMPANFSPGPEPRASEITIRPLREADLAEAHRIVRLAFDTFLGIPESQRDQSDADFARTRYRASPSSVFAAAAGDELIGSIFAANWGTVGFFGPLTVRPDYWDRGVGKRLLGPVLALFDQWGTKHAGLYTFAHSPKHIDLYRKFGFWPRFLTMIMAKPIAAAPAAQAPGASLFSEVSPRDRPQCLAGCRAVCDAVYAGLDLRVEIESVAGQALGDTVLLEDGDRLAGLAVCHVGPGTEAGSGTCYVKFGAVRPGRAAGAAFDRLLRACEVLGARRGASRLVAGVNIARHEAYLTMLARGFRTEFQGVTMHRPNEPGYSHPGSYVVDDWR
jgi:GNAT superfamily N-acetyltransferase